MRGNSNTMRADDAKKSCVRIRLPQGLNVCVCCRQRHSWHRLEHDRRGAVTSRQRHDKREAGGAEHVVASLAANWQAPYKSVSEFSTNTSRRTPREEAPCPACTLFKLF